MRSTSVPERDVGQREGGEAPGSGWPGPSQGVFLSHFVPTSSDLQFLLLSEDGITQPPATLKGASGRMQHMRFAFSSLSVPCKQLQD